MLFAVRRSKLLPEGGSIDQVDWAPMFSRLSPVHRHPGGKAGRLGFDDAARERWWQLYPALSEPEPGLLGAATARAEAHVVRLALLYVLFEGADRISLAHLDAAVALWDYAARSARWVFGGTLGAGVDAR